MGNNGVKIFAPASMSDIATVLGTTEDLARAQKKPWAKYQPFKTNGNPHKIQTDADRKDAAWGFYFDSDDPNAPCARNARDLFDKIVLGDIDWARKDIDVSRMVDFEGYNHAAVVGYETRLVTENSSTMIKEISIMKKFDSNAEIFMEMMPPVDNIELENYQIIGICRKENEQSGELVNTNKTVKNLTGGGSTISVKVDVPLVERWTTIDYDFIFAATNLYTIGATESKWIYFPESKISFIADGWYHMLLESDSGDAPFEAIDTNGRPLDSSSQEVKQISLSFNCNTNISPTPIGKYVLHVWDRNGGRDNGTSYEPELWADGYFKMQEVDIKEAMRGVRAENVMIDLTIYVQDKTYADAGIAKYTPYYFDFINNDTRLGVAGEEQAISVWEMQTKYGN